MNELELPLPQILSPCSSGRRPSTDSNSPEFEFWKLRNPSLPQPNLLSADELFSGGFLLPLHLLNHSDDPTPYPRPLESTGSDQPPEHEGSIISSPAADLSANPPFTSSKRWMDIFKKVEKKSSRLFINGGNAEGSNNSKEKKRDKKNGGGLSKGATAGAELNINIWPFSRSSSAGNGAGARPRSSAASRKVSSAPCSRSNSSGDSKSRKWPNSPSRGGVHLGRSSPVWQVRRGGSGRRSETFVKIPQKGVKNDGRWRPMPPQAESAGGRSSKARVLSLNVPMCIGYRQQSSCGTGENSAVVGTGGGIDGGGVRGGGNLFNIRSLFSKKVY